MVDEQTGYDDEQDRVDREDERIREARWAEFVAWARAARTEVLLNASARLMSGDTDPYHHGAGDDVLRDFAASEGWDGVLNAIARAYREEQQKG